MNKGPMKAKMPMTTVNGKKVPTRTMARDFKRTIKEHFEHIATGFNGHGIFFEKN